MLKLGEVWIPGAERREGGWKDNLTEDKYGHVTTGFGAWDLDGLPT